MVEINRRLALSNSSIAVWTKERCHGRCSYGACMIYMYTGKPCYNELEYNEVPVLTRQSSRSRFLLCVVQWKEQPFTTSSDIARFRL